jgi:hypothetical protein
MISTALTRARRSQAALALDPIPASKVQSVPLEFAELPRKTSHGYGWPVHKNNLMAHPFQPANERAL